MGRLMGTAMHGSRIISILPFFPQKMKMKMKMMMLAMVNPNYGPPHIHSGARGSRNP